MKENNIRKDYLWNTIGVFLQNAISPVLLVVITRINGVGESGLFSFAFSLALFFWALGIWGGRTYQVSDVKREYPSRSYISVRLMLAVGMLGGSLIFCALNNYSPLKTEIIVLLVLFKVLESVADAFYGILQIHNKLFISGRSLFYKSILGFSAFLAIDFYTKDILLASLGIFTINFLVLLLYDIPHARSVEKIWTKDSRIKHSVKDAVEIIKRCSPIAAVIFLSMFSLIIPRYFIDHFHASQIGYFGILAMPITALTLFITFILQPNVVRLSEHFNNNSYEKFKKIVNKLTSVTAIVGIFILVVAYLIGIQVLELVFGIDFSQYRLALVIVLFGAIFNAFVTIYINIFTIMRHFKAQFYILVFSNIALIIVCLLTIKQYGLIGGVILYSLANMFQFVLLIIAYNRLLKRVARIEV